MRFLLRFAPLLGTLTLGCSLGFDDSIAGAPTAGGAAGVAGTGAAGSAGSASAGKAGATATGGGGGAAGAKGGAAGASAGSGPGGAGGGVGGAGVGGVGGAGVGGSGGVGGGGGGVGGAGGGVGGTGGGVGGKGGTDSGGAGGGPIANECSAQLDGAQRCVGKTIEQCSGGQWQPSASSCVLGCVQKGVVAACQLCSPNEQSCDENTLLTCSADGTKNQQTKFCEAATPICVPSLRACVSCLPGTIKCVGATAVTCSAAGTYDLATAVDCGSAALCTEGSGCKNAACLPNSERCVGANIERCNATGTAYEPATACPLGNSCVEGKGCVECDQPSPISYCEANKVVSCQDGKRVVLATCPVGKCAAGVCTECVQGDVQCSPDGLTVSQCDASGQLVPKETCLGADRCRASLGKCAPCEPGVVSCDGDTLRQCSPAGTNDALATCGPGLCSTSQRSCLSCLVGTARCTGATLQTCSAQGQFQTADTCGAPGLCDAAAGVCRPPVCNVGEKRCGKDRTPQVCNADRSGFETSGAPCPVACLGAGVCANVVDVSAGGNQTCAIVGKEERVPVCWGLNQPNLFGGPTGEAAPRIVAGLDHIQKIELGDSFACVLGEDGAVRCWGNNDRGQLGDGTTVSRSTYAQVPLPGPASDLSVSVARGACAVAAGAVYCWGQRAGIPTNEGDFDVSPVKVQWPSPAVAVSVGSAHRCLIDSDQHVACWGSGNNGALGTGNTASTTAPSSLVVQEPTNTPLTGAHRISVSSTFNTHTCVATSSDIACWGGNQGGQLGWPPPAGSSAARAIDVGKAVVRLAVGAQFSCSGYSEQLRCWGSAETYGNGLEMSTPTPTSLTEVPGIYELDAGVGHACALTTGGQIVCWGDNQVGQLGVPSQALTKRSTAQAVALP